MAYIIGVDIGTTSVKTILYDNNGKIIESANLGYPLYQDTPDMAEEDPDDIFSAVTNGINTVMRKSKIAANSLKGVSFSCAMHSLILLDKNKKALTRAITWADNRSAKYAEQLKQSDLGLKLYKNTGTPIHAMTPLSKIIWLKNEKSELYKETKYFIGIKEYIINKLFGVLKVDYSIANATGLFNIFNLDWDKDALALTGLKKENLPELVDTTYKLKGLKKEYAKVIGINPKTPFIIGASDGPLANLGVNAIEPGVLAITIGTSGAVRMVSKKPRIDPKGRVFCYYLAKDMWVIGGPVNNGGIIFKWIRDQLCLPEKVTAEQMHINPYSLLTTIASKVPAGSDGLLFHPFLGGERAPIWDSNARGSYFGLNQMHTRAHMIRAALEGIVFNLYTVSLALEEVLGTPIKIQATGGFVNSNLTRQMLSDIFEQNVTIPDSVEGTALGAATLGMYSLGMINELSDVKNFVHSNNTYTPIKENVDVYRELSSIYIRLSRQLMTEYDQIAAFQRKHSRIR
ncbi:gluconokinase [Lactobacillus sp. S2-2]|uniref:gluconokinase n=1 Tax=Lactobacillus sp. S2-2 TaxID=2692917 RepID=UPI001F023468|nr:gluconokinase [Lactobacillus sp. S2-2]MCF6514813.1 gluconokinase [Lactobacillus sp. S2-2]